MPPAPTRTRLLDAAERLYAEHGVDATSLRAITSEAGANLAAVHYHFGSKQALTHAVFARRIVPINEDRLRRLESVERGAGDGPPPLEAVLESFILPALEARRDAGEGGERFVRLMGRIYTEPGGELGAMLADQFSEILSRFGAALAWTLPHLPPAELLWRFHFMVGAMIHTVADPSKLHRLSAGVCDPEDLHGVCVRLVSFVAAGMAAPVASLDGERA